VEVVASFSQGRTAAAQCGLFTHKTVPVIFEPPCIYPIKMLLFLNVQEVTVSLANLNPSLQVFTFAMLLQ